jgi:hypothetical protein
LHSTVLFNRSSLAGSFASRTGQHVFFGFHTV